MFADHALVEREDAQVGTLGGGVVVGVDDPVLGENDGNVFVWVGVGVGHAVKDSGRDGVDEIHVDSGRGVVVVVIVVVGRSDTQGFFAVVRRRVVQKSREGIVVVIVAAVLLVRDHDD